MGAPTPEGAGKRPSIRVFENPFLERFTHVHPITPLLIWGPVAIILIARSFVTLGLGMGRSR